MLICFSVTSLLDFLLYGLMNIYLLIYWFDVRQSKSGTAAKPRHDAPHALPFEPTMTPASAMPSPTASNSKPVKNRA